MIRSVDELLGPVLWTRMCRLLSQVRPVPLHIRRRYWSRKKIQSTCPSSHYTELLQLTSCHVAVWSVYHPGIRSLQTIRCRKALHYTKTLVMQTRSHRITEECYDLLCTGPTSSSMSKLYIAGSKGAWVSTVSFETMQGPVGEQMHRSGWASRATWQPRFSG